MSINSNKKVTLMSPTNQSTKSDNSTTNQSVRSTNSSIRKQSQSAENKYKALMIEKRILIAAFIIGLLASLVFLICFSTKYWIIVNFKTPKPRIDERGEHLKVGHYHGLWTFCRIELWKNSTVEGEEHNCAKMFFTFPEVWKPRTPPQKLAMERSTIAVGIISLLFGLLSHIFTYYSIDQLRYMYKRLSGCLHLISAATLAKAQQLQQQQQQQHDSTRILLKLDHGMTSIENAY
ncbi:hypothetical protein HELRODRAFT_175217 [Helobdella robusta]|uniref:Uncharacterized protein n=1 Tax=Helobdella robusta TaxID=6412 RepID=T1F911_HELRO|nr:hypothetical protein HELRODRAFT_175217 [Helobdella robusta]ESO01189.1 hypothetical protein HELRODRAFT_175217 [Helobdella robusta]